MEMFLENPLGVGAAGVLLVAVTLVGWLQSGKPQVLLAAVGLLLVTCFGVALSIWIQTDREKIKDCLYSGANELENNHYDLALSRIHPKATVVLQRAKGEIERYKFNMVRIVSMYDLTIDQNAQPPTASVSVDAIADGSFGGYSGKGTRAFQFKLMKHNDRWLVHDYQEGQFSISRQSPLPNE